MASLHPTSLALFCGYFLLANLILHSSTCQSAGTTTTYVSNVTDEAALLSFKSQVTHDPYAGLSSWTPNVSFCSWSRVACSIRRQRVTELDLTYMYLEGTLSPAIANLSFLRVLSLSVNSFHGNLVSIDFSRLFRLRVFSLSYNLLEGTIPPSLGRCSSLRSIDLSFNNFTGSMPPSLGGLPDLRALLVETNSLSGTIPQSLGNLTKLEYLSLTHNSLVGIIPGDLGGLSNLKDLLMGKNKLTGAIPSTLGNLSTNLQQLDLSGNQLEGRIPPEIANLTNLIMLTMENNRLSGVLPLTIGQLRNLQRLYFNGNMLQGSIPDQLYSLDSLAVLHLYDNQFSGPISDAVQNLTNLVELKLNSNNLSSMFPSGLWRLENLLLVDLSHNFLTGSLSMEDLRSSAPISFLDISVNKLSGSLPSALSELQMLQTLNLSWNSFQGLVPPTFGNLVATETLDLSHNSINGTIPESLASIRSLRFLDISFNQLEGEIPNHGIFTKLNASSFKGNHALCGAPKFQVPPCPTTRTNRKPRFRNIIVACIVAGIIPTTIFCILMPLILRKRKKQQVPGEESPRITHPKISYIELSRATDSFNESNLLCNGSFGSVYKGTLSDGTAIAVKVLNMQKDRAEKTFNAECEVLRKVKHRNLVKIITSCTNLDLKALVLEYMPNGNLDGWLFSGSGRRRLSLFERVDIMVDVACALEYLHHDHPEPIVHCDIKPNNILLDDNMTAYVADFGIAKMLLGSKSTTLTSALGTVGYIAPEFGLAGKVTTKVDVYSYGILLLETFTGKKPTDPMFGGDLSLRQWVAAAFPEAISNTVDDFLLLHHEVVNSSGISDVEQRSRRDLSMVLHEIFVPIVEIGLSCSEEYPEARMTMREVVAGLKRVRSKLGDLRAFQSTSTVLS